MSASFTRSSVTAAPRRALVGHAVLEQGMALEPLVHGRTIDRGAAVHLTYGADALLHGDQTEGRLRERGIAERVDDAAEHFVLRGS